MWVKDLAGCPEFIAGDGTFIRELIHPDKEDLRLRYSLAHAVVPPGEASLAHRLAVSEVYYILEGEGTMRIDAEAQAVLKGQAVYIPPGAVQFIENTGRGELKFLCIVDPAWRREYEEIGEGPSR